MNLTFNLPAALAADHETIPTNMADNGLEFQELDTARGGGVLHVKSAVTPVPVTVTFDVTKLRELASKNRGTLHIWANKSDSSPVRSR